MLNTTAVANTAGMSWVSTLANSIYRQLLDKLSDHTNIKDMASLAAADVCGRTVEICTPITITSNVTLSSHYQVRKNGRLIVPPGVVVTIAGMYLEANPYQQVFDVSNADVGALVGTMANSKHSMAWFGVDPTGAVNSGALQNKVFNYRITPKHWYPFGTYNATGVPLLPPTVNGTLPYQIVGDEGTQLESTIINSTDAGAHTAILDGTNLGVFNNITLRGPGQNGAAIGTAGCLMDGLALGGQAVGGSHIQMNASYISFYGVHFGMFWNCSDGHSFFSNVFFNGNYCSVCCLQTGSDFHFTNATSVQEQLGVVYFPENSDGLGVNFTIKTSPQGSGFYFRTMPWFFVGDAVVDARRAAITMINAIDVGSVIEGLNGEGIGNGFACLVGGQTYFKGVTFQNGGPNNNITQWAAYQVAPSNTAAAPFNRTDYCVIALGGILMNITDMGDQSIFAPGTKAVFFSNSAYCKVEHLKVGSVDFLNGLPWFDNLGGGCGFSKFVSDTPIPHSITMLAGDTNHTYTWDVNEVASVNYLMISLMFQNGAVAVPFSAQLSATNAIITFASPIPANCGALLSAYQPAI